MDILSACDRDTVSKISMTPPRFSDLLEKFLRTQYILYAWLGFITAKGHRAKLAKGKGT